MFVLALILGVGALLAVAAALAVGGGARAVERAFGSRIEEYFARQPDLQLAIGLDDELVNVAEAGLSPWPFDSDRVVANEVARLNKEGRAYDAMARRSPSVFLQGAAPFSQRPRAAAYETALAKFDERVVDHAEALREWLDQYRDAADTRSRTFDLALWVTNAKGAAYAEDVRLSIDLPADVEVVDKQPTVSPPPEPPVYVEPRPSHESFRPSFSGLGRPSLAPPSFATRSGWEERSDGQRVSRSLGNIHHDAVIELPEHLILRVPHGDRHVLHWTLFAKNGRRHSTGTLELVVPVPRERPPFAKLHGIESFPDVPFVDDDAELVKEVRASDPPTTPPDRPNTTDALESILAARKHGDWEELGLDVRERDEEN